MPFTDGTFVAACFQVIERWSSGRSRPPRISNPAGFETPSGRRLCSNQFSSTWVRIRRVRGCPEKASQLRHIPVEF